MNHLNDLLDDVSAEGPVDRLDLDDVITAGRSRVRRRRAGAGIAAAAVVGIAAVFVLPGGGGNEPQPTGPPQVSVLTLDDAAAAEEGRDYDVLQKFTAHSTDEAMTGDFVRGVLPDGDVVLQRYPNGIDGRSEVVVVGADGTTVIKTPAGIGNYLGAGDRYLVFGGVDGLGLLMIDKENGDVRGLVENGTLDTNTPAQPLTAPGGHTYIAGAARFGDDLRPIFDVDLNLAPPTEIARGGHVASYAGRVAWTDRYDAPVRTVTLRDQSGGTTSFDPHTGDCVEKGVALTAQRVVVTTNCNDRAGDSEYTDIVTRVDVFDLDGNPLTRIIDEDGFGPVRMSDRFVTLSSWEGGRAGTYTYDLETGQFLRMTEAMSGLAGNETGSGSTVVWEEQLDGDNGATYVVAQMR